MMQLLRIHNILTLTSLFALVACNDDASQDTLSGHEKSPLEVTAVLDVNKHASQTRAADKKFAANDQLVAYLRHVTWNEGITTAEADKRIPVVSDQASKLVTFTCTGSTTLSQTISDIYPFDANLNVEINSSNSEEATGLSSTPKLYWDDFSNSTAQTTDLRTVGHFLQSYYGYCYNGGAPISGTELDTDDKKAAGVIGWAIQTDQSGTSDSPTNLQKSDLLWSAEQIPVSYAHRDTHVDSNRAGLVIPYTHAMSKVTINVTAGEGFASNYNFAETSIKLDMVRTTCTATAPTAKLTFPTDGTGKADVTMQPGTGTGTRSFQAIIVPSILTVGNTFATITKMDGNTYSIPVTEAMVDATNGWGSQLTAAEEDVNNGTAQARPTTRASYDDQIPGGKGHEMKSGVHYLLNVTLKKTEVNVSATILDWDEVIAEGVGEIHFANDIKDEGNISEDLQNDGFDVYKSATNDNFGRRATHLYWNKTSRIWKYDPVIYWQGGTPEFFRALSNVEGDIESTPENESLVMENEKDALWGTTQAHSGTDADGQPYDYAEGAALKPRTGDVPLKFYHAMSKITFNLVDALKDNADPSARIDLKDATIQLTDLATGGKLNLNTGLIAIQEDDIAEGLKTFSEDSDARPVRMGYYAAMENGVATNYKEDWTIKDYVITPQSIRNKATVIITLADGTVYKAQLNKCTTEVVENGAPTYKPIDKWERGKHYTYTITLGKETITFRALVENWVPVDGGGKATLEWD